MRSIIKALVPTFILFSVFARITALDNLHRNIHGEVNIISLQSLMYYFSYFAPLLYAILFFTQLLIIVPLWDKLVNKGKVILPVLGFCFLLSAVISYITWSPENGYENLLTSVFTLFMLQVIYWTLNFFMLYIINRFRYFRPQPTT
ncbi:hypothetical protein [Mucilaginibacter phyllosphaerae]